MLTREPINPWPWSVNLGFDQAELVQGHRRQLLCSGQDSVDGRGQPLHPGDMAAQVTLSIDNLEAVLAGAEMTLANVVRITVYTTDVEELFKHWPVLTDRFAQSGSRFATTVVGVTRLASRHLLLALEATAVD